MPAPFSGVNPTSSDLFRDVQATFMSTYREVTQRSVNLPQVMRLGLPSTKRTERYGYFESIPLIDRLDRGEAITEDGANIISYSVENLTWGKSIGFYEDDLEDLQLGDIRAWARGLAKRAATLPEEVLFQILTGSGSSRLLEAIPNAPDGAALYATTAGGSARFGATNGNLLTGSGVAAASDIRADFWSAVSQAKAFQDTEGEPLLDHGLLNSAVLVYNSANDEVFTEAFKQTRTLQIVQNVGGTENVGGAAVTNTVLEGGMNMTLWGTQRLTDNDWFVFFPGVDPKPVFEQVRRGPRMIDENRENSERARRYRMLATMLDMRSGFGINAAYGTVKINN